MSTTEPTHIAIAGAGILGLATAYILTEHGHKVTIIARDLPDDAYTTAWASPWAGALLAPHPDISHHDLQLASLRIYQHLANTAPESGIINSKISEYYTDRPPSSAIWYAPHMPSFHLLPASSRPPNATMGYTYTGLLCNPTIFLPWISSILRQRGVCFVRATLSSLSQIRALLPGQNIDLIVNATGLGAAQLANDPLVRSARGQTMFVRCPQGARVLEHAMLLQGSEYTYVIPRPGSGGVIIGGVSQYGNESVVPDVSLRSDILGRVNRMTGGAFKWVNLERDVEDVVGFRPGREGGLRVEREGDVVHAYGAASWGYVYAFGVAERVRDLLEQEAKARL